MGLEDLYRDSVKIEKPDGETLGPVKASVQKRKIHLQAKHPLEPGDVLIREMPFGKPERYVVDEPGYSPGLQGIPPHFQADVRREGEQGSNAVAAGGNKTPVDELPPSVTYNIYGPNARVNQSSADHSVNITIDTSDSVFDDLRSELFAQVDDAELREKLSSLVDEMEKAKGDSPTMSQKLGQFISTGSNVMGIIGPFIPMLTGIASGAG
ncbi:hypothetical protein [Halomonas sp. LBP4]|uniref:hypothetical protein n=1 Tax=Halomonas sp. LBP4 TaxID=2044917 RepID=UPI000D751C6F|nr:hypothetical protein [Halomonas sp. LBP4]PXX99691.1 hypothetical protein CR157_02670 [Halomonas sp. LBP4]